MSDLTKKELAYMKHDEEFCHIANIETYAHDMGISFEQAEKELERSDLISKQMSCVYCHEDSDGYVTPLEKNGHAFICFGMNGWEISLKAKGWNGSAKIIYCPMCGRRLVYG